MGSADYFLDGEWNFYCQLCGRKAKSSTAVRTWDGFYVCAHHKEVRNPQDRLRGVRENFKLPWYAPNPVPAPLLICSVQGSTAVAGLAVAGCMIPGGALPN